MAPGGLFFTFAVLASSSMALGASRERVIWNFDTSLTNSLGGQYGAFSKQPSWTRTYLDSTVQRSSSGHSLRITAHRAPQGFCGVWFDFYPAAPSPQRYFDARPYSYLVFWVKGQKNGGDFEIKVVDQTGQGYSDALATRPLHTYLPGGITTGWQQVTIPLADFPEVEPGSLGQLVFIFSRPGDYRIYVDDISFESSPGSLTDLPTAQAERHLPAGRASPYRAMWLWNTKDLFNTASEPERLFALCSRLGLKDLYLSLDFKFTPDGATPQSIENPAGYRNFLTVAHRQGLTVEALTGAAEWAASEYHARAKTAIQTVIDFNAASPAGARFDGIHFDVEPYVLLGFADPGYQKQLLEEYLTMVAECAEAARSARVPFAFDVPWWFFPSDPAVRRQFTVRFQNSDKTVGEHLLDLLDTVTIMDYRNEADGAGGIISFGSQALTYAAQVNKKIVVGLETSQERAAPIDFILAIPAQGFAARLRKDHLLDQRSFERYRIHALHDDRVIFIGLGPPPDSGPRPTESIETALEHLRETFGAKSAERFSVKPVLDQARSAIAEDPAWEGCDIVELRDPGSGRSFTAFRTTHGMLPVVTFHGLGRKVFEEESASAAEWLGRYSSFGGIAIHYYRSFQALLAEP